MNLSDEIANLQELRDSGTLTDVEFAQAKARVLNNEQATPQYSDAASERRLMLIELQIRLAELDSEWESLREGYMVSSRYGTRYIPTQCESLLSGVTVVIIGTFLLFITVSAGALAYISLFCIVLIMAGIASGIRNFSRASEYQQNEAVYQQRRATLLAQQEELQRRARFAARVDG